MPRRVSDLVNRRIAFALIASLLVQSLLPGLAMALPSAPAGGEMLLICTEEGLKEVALDRGAQQGDGPQAQPCCPCAILCGAYALAPVDSLGARVALRHGRCASCPLRRNHAGHRAGAAAPVAGAAFLELSLSARRSCGAGTVDPFARKEIDHAKDPCPMRPCACPAGAARPRRSPRRVRSLHPCRAGRDASAAILAQSDQMPAHGGHGDTASFAVGDLVVENPWARESVTRTGAAYLTVRNGGAADDRLIGVASEVADRAELHGSEMQDGVMRMRPVEAVEVPAHGQAALEPGGLHVMLIGLKAPLEEGGSFALTLTFENAGEVEVVTTIEDIAHGGAGHDHDQGN